LVDFLSPIVPTNEKSFIMTNLLNHIIQDYLGEALYDAKLITY